MNGVGEVTFRSLVMAGGGDGAVGGDVVQALSWFCKAWICCVSMATCSLSDDMMVGNGKRKVRGFEVFFCCQSTCLRLDSDRSPLDN